MTKVRTLDDIDIRGKRVLLRANLNVPMKNGTVTIRPALIASHQRSSLLDRYAKVIVMSHFGPPKGARDPAFSLWPRR